MASLGRLWNDPIILTRREVYHKLFLNFTKTLPYPEKKGFELIKMIIEGKCVMVTSLKKK